MSKPKEFSVCFFNERYLYIAYFIYIHYTLHKCVTQSSTDTHTHTQNILITFRSLLFLTALVAAAASATAVAPAMAIIVVVIYLFFLSFLPLTLCPSLEHTHTLILLPMSAPSSLVLNVKKSDSLNWPIVFKSNSDFFSLYLSVCQSECVCVCRHFACSILNFMNL